MSCQDLATFRVVQARVIARLYAQSGAERWALSQESLAEALHRSAAHRFPDGAPDSEIARYLASLARGRPRPGGRLPRRQRSRVGSLRSRVPSGAVRRRSQRRRRCPPGPRRFAVCGTLRCVQRRRGAHLAARLVPRAQPARHLGPLSAGAASHRRAPRRLSHRTVGSARRRAPPDNEHAGTPRRPIRAGRTRSPSRRTPSMQRSPHWSRGTACDCGCITARISRWPRWGASPASTRRRCRASSIARGRTSAAASNTTSARNTA